MLGNMFRRLTAQPKRGKALFDAVVAEARKPHWYTAGEVADSIDGRFAALATVAALVIIRLEQGSEALQALSVSLTERFIESMDSEHRELGLNDPGLGRRVRKLVGALERRVDAWRDATHGETGWTETALSSLYRDSPPHDDALNHGADSLGDLWRKLGAATEQQLAEGHW